MCFSPIDEILKELTKGKMVVLLDDPNRENEGDLAIPAEKVTPEIINFMAKYGRGIICLALTEEKADILHLEPQTLNNTSKFATAFTISIDAKEGTTTGVSAFDRAHTIQTAIRDNCTSHDLARPGHIFPLRAKKGGVLVRAGQTEGIVDLARLAGFKPAGVICEIMNDDGTMARVPQLTEFIKKHDLKMCTVADLIQYRRRTEKLVHRSPMVKLPTRYGDFNLIVYRSDIDPLPHLALCKGDVGKKKIAEPVLVRIHSQCITGDIFHSKRCDCGQQLEQAMAMVEKEGQGAIIYLRQEGRGIGLENKAKAYQLQEEGLDTVEANEELGFPPDMRDYGIGAQIINDLGLSKLRIITNNPMKMVALEGYGIQIVERVPIEIPPTDENLKYLKTECEKLGHLLQNLDEEI